MSLCCLVPSYERLLPHAVGEELMLADHGRGEQPMAALEYDRLVRPAASHEAARWLAGFLQESGAEYPLLRSRLSQWKTHWMRQCAGEPDVIDQRVNRTRRKSNYHHQGRHRAMPCVRWLAERLGCSNFADSSRPSLHLQLSALEVHQSQVRTELSQSEAISFLT
ncbi:hypothetical protein K469DRAFT_240458 [Zopfia rhizophila CBS 207.26]|uniref:Uncharacterized protein n=1 Tax=Zopfia rhizophila CBS 207.26 TaxID=1314779 RepID=A0A6A6ERS3_9PEZI|nr:hypothetical protein K469DRAFT_240458 [Zopfia rhizophila CBS 207.26]